MREIWLDGQSDGGGQEQPDVLPLEFILAFVQLEDI